MVAWLETIAWGLACASVLVGLGALIQPLLAGGPATNPARAFWCGLAVAMPLLFAWHLLAPIDGGAAGALAAAGLTGLVKERRALLAGLRRLAREHPGALAAWGLAGAALPLVTLQPLTCVDSGFYYVASVEWHRAFAQVPGLQATNPLSVMNAGNFLLTAAVGTGPFAHEGHLVLNGLLAWWGLPLAIGGLEQVARTGSPRGFVVALAAAPGVDALLDDRMSCPSADIGVMWLGVAMSALALAEPRPGGSTLRPALLITILAPLYKMSLAPFSLVLLGLALFRHRHLVGRRAVALALGLGALAWAPYVAGNIITSGYPLYPSAVLGVRADWALPPALVRQVSHIIRSYSAHDGVVGEATLPEQVERLLLMNRAVLLPMLLLVGGCLLALVRRLRGARPELAPLVAAWACVGLWFLLAPDPRFAGAALWVMGALSLVTALPRGVPEFASRVALTGVALLLLLGDLPFMVMPSLPTARPELPNNDQHPRSSLVDGTLILDCTPRDTVMSGEGPASPISGKTYSPCWSVPSAAIFPEGLRRRDANDLSRGFKLPPEAKLPKLSIE